MQGQMFDQSNAAGRSAALRAYGELRESGVVDRDAFHAAVRVLRYHHPQVHSRQACDMVAEWIEPDA
ncbi:MAG: hypothetical protein ACE363_06305 [Alphaproteobacteria bacterium]